MVRFLKCTACWGAALIRGRRLLEVGTFSDLCVKVASLIRGQHVFETQPLLEEMWYLFVSVLSIGIEITLNLQINQAISGKLFIKYSES